MLTCNIIQQTVLTMSTQMRSNPKVAPALAAVVTVPGPMNAAEITDQNRMEENVRLVFKNDQFEICQILLPREFSQ